MKKQRTIITIIVVLIFACFLVQGCSKKRHITAPTDFFTSTPQITIISTVTQTKTSLPSFTPTTCCSGLPDLIITGVFGATMKPPVPSCVPPGGPFPPCGIIVYYSNIGAGDAGSFIVDIQGYTATASALSSGMTGSVWIENGILTDPHIFTIDSTNLVTESNESNNTYTGIGVLATPSLPPTCVVSVVTTTCTRTMTFTSTPTCACPILTSTNTKTTITTQTPTCACLISVTPTVTMTVTATSGSVCYSPKIRAGNSMVPPMEEFTPGHITYVSIYTHTPGQQLKVAFYDGDKKLLQSMNYTTDGSGYFTPVTYTVTGLETKTTDASTVWVVALMDASGTAPAIYSSSAFLDSEEIWMMTGAPAPTPTANCTNTGMLYMDPARTYEKYNFNLNSCDWLYYADRHCDQDAQVLYYDGANNLVHAELCTCTAGDLISQYNVTGLETPGIWSIILFKPGFTAPTTKPASNNPNIITNCTNIGASRVFKVQVR